MERYQVTITGTMPILFHHDDIDWADSMEGWKNNPANKNESKAGDDRTPAFRWIGNLYHDGRHICVPADNIMSAIREGGAMVPVGKGNKTFKRQSQSGIAITEAYWPMLVNGKKIEMAGIFALMDETDFSKHKEVCNAMGFSLLVKRAKINNSKKHVRVRPRFDNWSICGELLVIDKQITETVLRDILTYAGTYIGLGDWRPGNGKTVPGQYGTFSAQVKRIA